MYYFVHLKMIIVCFFTLDLLVYLYHISIVSGTLATGILDCDIFASAAYNIMPGLVQGGKAPNDVG